jgi:multiple sugar transport system ATP-binding protein
VTGEAGEGLTLPLNGVSSAAAGRPAIYGVRPEHFRLVADGSGVPVEVVVVEPMGSETQIVVRGGGQEMICVFRDRILPEPGAVIRIAPEPAATHLFDAQTGQRLQ